MTISSSLIQKKEKQRIQANQHRSRDGTGQYPPTKPKETVFYYGILCRLFLYFSRKRHRSTLGKMRKLATIEFGTSMVSRGGTNRSPQRHSLVQVT